MSKAFTSAVAMLARREHGNVELLQKLTQKGHDELEIEEALIKCKALGLQCDARFADNVCRARIRQGYGPIRIRLELQNKQIDSDIIEQVLREESDNWVSYAREVWNKKYKRQGNSFAEVQKQKQFLLYRGFSTDTITMVFNEL